MADKSRRALITGGGSGIGLAIAQRFATSGIEVTVAGRNTDRLKKTGFSFVEIDVTDEQSVAAGVKAAGPIDIFVNNAGAAQTAPIVKTSRELWDSMLSVNLTAAYLCAREVLPGMAQCGWGRFIVIASTASLKGYAYTGAYAAAKHGVVGLVRTAAIEMAKTGVTVNAICPGFTDTDIVRDSVANIVAKTGRAEDEALSALTRENPMGRLIDPREVADTALWLAGEDAASVNGQAIAIDGGETVS